MSDYKEKEKKSIVTSNIMLHLLNISSTQNCTGLHKQLTYIDNSTSLLLNHDLYSSFARQHCSQKVRVNLGYHIFSLGSQ